MLFRETVAVYCENHTEHVLYVHSVGKQRLLLLKQVVPIVTTVPLNGSSVVVTVTI
jgi:hypothetical protein